MPPASERSRYGFFGAFLALGLGCAVYTQAQLQLVNRETVLELAERAHHQRVNLTDHGRRGSIYSADGHVLAETRDALQLTVVFRKVPASPGFDAELATAAGIPVVELSAAREAGAKGRTWRHPISGAMAAAIRDVKKRWRADGVSLGNLPAREYPLGFAAAGVTGIVRDGEALAGIEKSLDATLTATSVERTGSVDRTGAVLAADSRARGPKHGDSVRLTIDSQLQVAAARAIRQAVEARRAKGGAVIVMEPSTGNVLAMADWPTFDPSAEDASGLIGLNHCTGAAYEPGSTFKILTLAKALDAGSVPSDYRYHCVGQTAVGSKIIRCDDHSGSRAHGTIDLRDAISRSCNVSAAIWAMKVGRPGIIQLLDAVRLLDRPGIGLPGEVGGKFNRKDPAELLQVANVGFGQSLTATPLGLAAAFSIVANGGRYVPPRLVDSIAGRTAPRAAPRQVVSPEVAHEVLGYMEAVIEGERGTGRSLRIPGYRLAGKTGTAQKFNPATRKVGGLTIANFVGFVPADRPRALILVMVDEPSDGLVYGGAVAGPVFRELAKRVIQRLEIPPSQTSGSGAVQRTSESGP